MVRSLVLAALIGSATPAVSEEPSFDQRVNDAIDRGVRWLLHQQELDGSFPTRAHQGRAGLTAFTAYTLLKSGVPGRHHAIRRALARLEGIEPHLTYESSATLLALAAHPDDHEPWMQAHADALMDWRHENGFGYPVGQDLSNTQFGTLGLWAASRAGIDVPAHVWVELVESVFDYQDRKGGFAYKHARRKVTGSMTTAGLGVLALCRERLLALDALDEDLALLIDESLGAGLEWLGEEFSVTQNPGVGRGWHLYYLYGLERLGALLSLTDIGGRDWYREGALELLELQEASGYWLGKGDYAPVSSTCFALLFLRRATKPVTGGGRVADRPSYGYDNPSATVSVRAEGDAELDLWIGRLGWQELQELCREGEETPRVDLVEFLIGDEVVASIEGDLEAPADLASFRVQHVFEAPGEYQVRARVRALRPDAKHRRSDAFVVLTSEPLDVDIVGVTPDWMLGLAREAQLNTLRPSKNLVIDVSSKYSGDVPGAEGRRQPNEEIFLVDNAPGTAWIARERDRKPKVRMDFEEPVDADAVVLLPVQGLGPEAYAPALQVELIINKRHKQRVEMNADPRTYTRVELGQVRSIERLDLKVLKKGKGEALNAVGFAEVQFQLSSKPSKKRSGAGRGR